MDFNAFQTSVAQWVRKLGIEDYELYYQSSESTHVSIYRQEVNEFSSAVDGGVCFRCIVNGRMGYASTEELSEAAAEDVVRRAVDNAATLETEEPVFLGQGGQQYQSVDCAPASTRSSSGALIQAALDTQSALYAAHPSVVDGTSAEGVSETVRLAIVNSKGLDLHYENTVSGLIAAAVVKEGEEMSNAYQLKLAPLDTLDKQALGVPCNLCPGGHGQPAGGLQPRLLLGPGPEGPVPAGGQGGGGHRISRRHPGGRPLLPPERHAYALRRRGYPDPEEECH